MRPNSPCNGELFSAVRVRSVERCVQACWHMSCTCSRLTYFEEAEWKAAQSPAAVCAEAAAASINGDADTRTEVGGGARDSQQHGPPAPSTHDSSRRGMRVRPWRSRL